jgi:hypothetical protein
MRILFRFVLGRVQAFQKRRRIRRLRLRFEESERRLPLSPSPTPRDDVFSGVNVVVINLDSRGDRLESVTGQLASVGITEWTRISAVDGKSVFPDLDPFFAGSAGCSLSHIEALEQGSFDAPEAVMVCEDDLEFIGSREQLSACVEEFLTSPNLDVLCIAVRARGGSHHVSKKLRVIIGGAGRGCYLVKPHMVTRLLDAYQAGMPKLMAGDRAGKGDRMWHPLQQKGSFFAAPIGQLARQGSGFSDIEGRDLGPR